MAISRTVQGDRVARMEARTRFLRGMLTFGVLVVGVALGFVVLASALPQKRLLAENETRLAEAKQREAGWLAECDYRRSKFQALREEPAYIELHARDRLDVYQPGERIFRIQRGE